MGRIDRQALCQTRDWDIRSLNWKEMVTVQGERVSTAFFAYTFLIHIPVHLYIYFTHSC